MEGCFTGADGNNASLQATVQRNLFFAGTDLFKGNGDVVIQLFAFRREADTPVGADEQGTSQSGFQIFNRAGNVGLIVQKEFCSLCEIFAFGNVIKNAVIVVTDIHKNS